MFILTGAVDKAGVYHQALKNIGRKLYLSNQKRWGICKYVNLDSVIDTNEEITA